MSIPDPVSLDNLLSLHGRCAVVTGGSRGLGEAIKSLATIDRMSGGRLIAGIGVGWNEAEFAALGVPFHERGARTDKYLRLWQACWAPGKVSFAGRFFSFSDMHVNPKAGAGAASADLELPCECAAGRPRLGRCRRRRPVTRKTERHSIPSSE
jgi:hypothetical protein